MPIVFGVTMSKYAKNDNTLSAAINSNFYSLEAEQSLLGCALIDSRTVQDILLNLTEEDFYSPANKIVFASMRDMQVIFLKPVC